jgi:hypothetical protein
MPFEKHPEELALISDKVSQLTMPILEHKVNHDDLTVSAAMQASANLRLSNAGPLIWATAINPSASTQLRLSAIGSLEAIS